MFQEDRSVSHLTRKQRDGRYNFEPAENRGMDTKPLNQDERGVIKTPWSIVSKAAERSSRQRHYTFCDPVALT